MSPTLNTPHNAQTLFPYFVYIYCQYEQGLTLFYIQKKKNGIFNIINTCYIPMIMSNTAYI